MLWRLLFVIFMIFQSLGKQEQFVQFHFLCFLLCKQTILKLKHTFIRGLILYSVRLMLDPEGNSFVFPRVLMFPLTSSRENRTLGKTKLTGFLRDLTWSVFKSSLSLIVRVNVVLNRTVVVDSDWRFDNLCGSQSELYCVSNVDGIILRLLIWLVNYVTMLLVVCQLSRDVIGYEDS